MTAVEPPAGCALCPRLAAYRRDVAKREPDWFNAPVPSWGSCEARLLVVGLAPGVSGANRTGRPFTGDYAGNLLYATLLGHGFATGLYAARPDDGLSLVDCVVTNAVRCVPPQNKPATVEIATCRQFLAAQITALPKLRAVVTLGRIAHDSTLRALGARPSALPFAHGATGTVAGLGIFASYHCSRYNTNTGRLTPAMFEAVFADVRAALGPAPAAKG